ncbi:MAG TPA: SLC13 family permease [Nitrososphaerales archaeon]|nr:SLC13 family permease [Nitrososphaerales archaeon]
MTLDLSIFVSLAFLFGIAAQFRAADGYSFLRGIISALEGRLGLMYAVVAVTAIFSPFVLNDVLVLILTPVLVSYSKESGSDIAPLLVAEITFTNIAGSLTPLGNPQNILLWQASGISFGEFVAGAWLRLVASGAIATLLLFVFRARVSSRSGAPSRVNSWLPAVYLAAAAAIVFTLNFAGVSNVLALGLAFALGFAFTFRSPRKLAREFDLRSLLILFALVAVVALLADLIKPSILQYVSPAASGEQPYTAGFFGLVSAVISNVPATQLVLSTSPVAPHTAPILAVDAGLAGNIDPISSFANLLALLMVARSGLPVRKSIVLQLAIGLAAFLPAAL